MLLGSPASSLTEIRVILSAAVEAEEEIKELMVVIWGKNSSFRYACQFEFKYN